MGVYDTIFSHLAVSGAPPDTRMIDATHLKAHRTASSLLKRNVPHHIGRTKGGLNSKLHAIVDEHVTCPLKSGPILVLVLQRFS